MRRSTSSLTAAYVASLRALGASGMTSVPGFHDAAASAMLSLRSSCALVSFQLAARALPVRARDRVTEHVDLFVHRSLAIDAALVKALDAGCRQAVIIGAGFDSRAHRLGALANARVFEVDHPATQREKRRRAARVPHTCGELTYVACDLDSHTLDERLESAGHRSYEATVWILEGLTLYLDDSTFRATLATIAKRSARQSTIIVEYHDNTTATVTLYTLARRALLALVSEQQLGRRSKHAMHAELGLAGFQPVTDARIRSNSRARLLIAARC